MRKAEERCRVCRRILEDGENVRVVRGRPVCLQCCEPRHPDGCSCGDPDCPENPYREMSR